MSVTTLLAVCASSWGVAMALAPALQIRAIVAHRSSHGVSLGYLSVLVVGFVLWLGYGVALASAALIVPNVIALLMGITTIAVVLRYRPSSPVSPSQ
ncbi:MAG TPA: SemiSWEET family transporter [Gemmatimonadaceae bacterium]|nr:SemiSWEET family transporter [Gemmatimonadaceae bacterium]